MNLDPVARAKANAWMFEQTKGIVQSGPFKGMKMVPDFSWDGGSGVTSQLLGTYEEELHPALEHEIWKLWYNAAPRIVNVGCAEGYYAVGLGRRLPKATIYAVDIDENAFVVTNKLAEMNGVKVICKEDLGVVFSKPDLVVMDCEGYETIYLDFERHPDLKQATIIVECHDAPPGVIITPVLQERFGDTHNIQNVIEGARDPNKFEFMHKLTSIDRWLLISEGRPCLMNWLVMRPKSASASSSDPS